MTSLLRQKFAVLPALGLLVSLAVAGAVSAVHASVPATATRPAAVSLTALDAVTTKAAAAAAPSVVKIESSVGVGSGVIIDARGYIMTNYQVLVGSSGDATAPSYTVTLSTGATRHATIAGADSTDDLALLKITAS